MKSFRWEVPNWLPSFLLFPQIICCMHPMLVSAPCGMPERLQLYSLLLLFALKEPYARGREMIDSGCVALATDLNPGSCFSGSIPLTFALACIYMRLTIEEAITALTPERGCCPEPGWTVSVASK